MDLSVIIVNYNTREFLDSCLRSLDERSDAVSTEVIVVDNGSLDGSQEMVRSRHPGIRLIENGINRGFAAANNRGIRESMGKYLLLLNSDTMLSRGALEGTVGFAEEMNLKGIVGCKLLNSDGTLQPSVRSFPTIMNVASETFFLSGLFPHSRIFGKYYMSFFDYSAHAEVDWVMGAFLMFHRDVLEAVGMLDERFFMFGEEIDFCYRARQSGFRTWYFPGASVFHRWGGSSKTFYTRILWTKGSQLLFFQKHNHGIRRYTLYALLVIGMILRIPFHLSQGLFLMKSDPIHKAYCYARAAVTLPFHLMNQSIYRQP